MPQFKGEICERPTCTTENCNRIMQSKEIDSTGKVVLWHCIFCKQLTMEHSVMRIVYIPKRFSTSINPRPPK